MGAPLRLMEATICLLSNLCHALLAWQKKKKKPKPSFCSLCLSLFHSFLFGLSLFNVLLKLFPFWFITVIIIASDIFQENPGIWLIYTHAFITSLQSFMSRGSKGGNGLFCDKEFLFTLQRRQSKKVPYNWSRWGWPWLFLPGRLI